MKLAALLLVAATLPVLALPTGAPPGNTGAPGDNTCAACHRTFPLNPEGGSVKIETAAYKPGMAQTVRITVSHPEAVRWGFQITARWARDLNQSAGVFTAPSADVQLQRDGTYATHTVEGTRTNGANGTKTFEVQWTPPAGMDDGDIVFYAAGNASNGGTGNQGDRIFTTQSRVLADGSCSFTEKPVITRVVDAGSYNNRVSTGALVTIIGDGFAPVGVTRTVHGGYIRDNKFPTDMGCLAVEVAGVKAPLLYVSRQQLNIQMPVQPMTGQTAFRVIMNPDKANAVASEPGFAMVTPFSPAFFTFNGRTVAARSGASIIANPSIVPEARPARPGETVELYLTGLGATQPSVAPGAIAPLERAPTVTRVRLTIGTTTLTEAAIPYAGLAPGNISGLYQINATIPAGTPNGDVPILLVIGDEQSVAGTTIPVQAP